MTKHDLYVVVDDNGKRTVMDRTTGVPAPRYTLRFDQQDGKRRWLNPADEVAAENAARWALAHHTMARRAAPPCDA